MSAVALAQQDQTVRGPLRVDKDMFELAAATGGDFYFWAPGEFAAAKLQIPLHGEDVVLAYGTVDGKRVFEIPVESGVQELTLVAGIQRKDLAVLLRPDGTPERDAVQSYQHMTIAIVKSPPPGQWKLELQGAGTFAVTAHVKATASDFSPAERLAVAKDGSTIMGTPTVPYRIMTRGTDQNGAPWQRIESHLRQPVRFLALGDSYTIGESVAESDRWPNQLAEVLKTAKPQIIAKTGWTTDELNAAIDAADPHGPFDLVTLLIGVNNQYRGRDAEEYRRQFVGLLNRAIGFAAGKADRVIVVSIPDWGVTPFAAKRDRAAIARDIDRFNAINREEAGRAGAGYVDITRVSRARAELVAGDGLHPSAAMYAEWVKLVTPAAREALGPRP